MRPTAFPLPFLKKHNLYVFFLKKFGNATDVELCLWRLYPDPLCVVAEALGHEGEAAVETSDGLGLDIFFVDIVLISRKCLLLDLYRPPKLQKGKCK